MADLAYNLPSEKTLKSGKASFALLLIYYIENTLPRSPLFRTSRRALDAQFPSFFLRKALGRPEKSSEIPQNGCFPYDLQSGNAEKWPVFTKTTTFFMCFLAWCRKPPYLCTRNRDASNTCTDRYAPHLPERRDAAEVGKPRLRLLIEMIS